LLPAGNPLRSVIVIGSPKVLQAIIAGLGDWYTWQLAVKIFGPDTNTSFFAVCVPNCHQMPGSLHLINPLSQLFLQLFNPWQWYCSTRTFSNSLETTLTIMALYYWPWAMFHAAKPTKENPKPANTLGTIWELRASLCLAALAVVLRPTNVLIWATIAGMALTKLCLSKSEPLTWSAILVLARETVLCGSFVLAISVVSDYLYFGFWVFPPYNWLTFNISKSLAVFYGRNPWHYYLSQGIPLLCTTSLPFAFWGLYKPTTASTNESNTLRVLSYTVFTTTGALSLISHKEVRFIYPLLPILSILAAPAAALCFTSSPPPSSSKSANTRPRLRRKPYLLAALGVNFILAGYLSFLHQPAPLNVLTYLRKEYERIHPTSVQIAHKAHQPPSSREELFALFLMPCHSTPWRSHLYYPGLDAYALSCEPPLDTQPNTPARDNYRDEADRFYDDPIGFLANELFAPQRALDIPRYIVGFEGIEPWLVQFLETPKGRSLGMKPRRVWGGFNGLFNEDWRRSGRMLVWDTGVYEDAPPMKNQKAII
jgi:phosphatidylinositol glycan class B